MKTKFTFRDQAGKNQEGEVAVTDYAEASAAGLSLTQHLNRKFPTDESQYGSILTQALTSNNLILKSDPKLGLQSSSMKEMFNANISMGAIVAPDGSGNNTPAGRIFAPEVILQTIAANLSEDKSDFFQGYESLLSGTENVNANEFKRAKIDVTAPEGSQSQSTAQLAEPSSMVSITSADSTTPIPSKSIGLMVANQALASTSIDLVNIIMERQAYGERVRMVEGSLADCFNGNTDLGLTPLTSVKANTLDTAIATVGQMTQKAWIHYLRQNYQTMNLSRLVMTIDTALAIEARTGKPTNQSDDPNSPRIDSLFSIDNLGITPPSVFLVDAAVVPENTIVGLDPRYALRRYNNVSASFEATEAFILRQAQAFRVDYATTTTRLFDDAFSTLDLTL